MNETKTVFVAYTNVDGTEGRGRDVPIAVCLLEITAIRLAQKQYVQGSDGPVRALKMVRVDGQWYVPTTAINVIEPTREDEAAQKQLDEERTILAKAKAAGLTDDEIKSLRGGNQCTKSTEECYGLTAPTTSNAPSSSSADGRMRLE